MKHPSSAALLAQGLALVAALTMTSAPTAMADQQSLRGNLAAKLGAASAYSNACSNQNGAKITFQNNCANDMYLFLTMPGGSGYVDANSCNSGTLSLLAPGASATGLAANTGTVSMYLPVTAGGYIWYMSSSNTDGSPQQQSLGVEATPGTDPSGNFVSLDFTAQQFTGGSVVCPLTITTPGTPALFVANDQNAPMSYAPGGGGCNSQPTVGPNFNVQYSSGNNEFTVYLCKQTPGQSNTPGPCGCSQCQGVPCDPTSAEFRWNGQTGTCFPSSESTPPQYKVLTAPGCTVSGTPYSWFAAYNGFANPPAPWPQKQCTCSGNGGNPNGIFCLGGTSFMPTCPQGATGSGQCPNVC